ncbi:MAG: hypothetical protein VKL00_12420, partial [Synechococcales bacterium]|nr:hypothetical protein [Synechococcales bacterium]
SITSDVVITCIDSFFPTVNKRTVIVVDQAPIHTNDYMHAWINLVDYVEKVLREFGENYVINFV